MTIGRPGNRVGSVEQQFEHLPDGLSGIRLQAEHVDGAEALIAERRASLRDGMTQTLARIRALLVE
jgi:hypothetical protein